MKRQLPLLTKPTKQHGGSLALRKRRAFRPLSPRRSHHITLKSRHAVGGRCLLKHKKQIVRTMRHAAQLFEVKIYEYAICGNHLHLIIKGPDREHIQNFFRVFAGHTAQRILKKCPLPRIAGGALGCKKNQRKFWSYPIYSRIVSWGREFKAVVKYIQKNTLEALNIIAYQPRAKNWRDPTA